jgi:hypothetical protein
MIDVSTAVETKSGRGLVLHQPQGLGDAFAPQEHDSQETILGRQD